MSASGCAMLDGSRLVARSMWVKRFTAETRSWIRRVARSTSAANARAVCPAATQRTAASSASLGRASRQFVEHVARDAGVRQR